jgi:hypothetical protein
MGDRGLPIRAHGHLLVLVPVSLNICISNLRRLRQSGATLRGICLYELDQRQDKFEVIATMGIWECSRAKKKTEFE